MYVFVFEQKTPIQMYAANVRLQKAEFSSVLLFYQESTHRILNEVVMKEKRKIGYSTEL